MESKKKHHTIKILLTGLIIIVIALIIITISDISLNPLKYIKNIEDQTKKATITKQYINKTMGVSIHYVQVKLDDDTKIAIMIDADEYVKHDMYDDVFVISDKKNTQHKIFSDRQEISKYMKTRR